MPFGIYEFGLFLENMPFGIYTNPILSHKISVNDEYF